MQLRPLIFACAFARVLGGCLFVVIAVSLRGGETNIVTRDGKTYLNAVVQRTDPDGIVIQYKPEYGGVGVAKLKFNNLSDALQQDHRYDPSKALIFERNQASGNTKRLQNLAKAEVEKKRRDEELLHQRHQEEQRAIAAAAARQREEEIAKQKQEEMAQNERLIQALQYQPPVIYNETVVVQSQPVFQNRPNILQTPSPRYEPLPRYEPAPRYNPQLDTLNYQLLELNYSVRRLRNP
jgi:hypothetical protein